MAFRQISVDHLPPVFMLMVKQKKVDKPQFAFYLESTGQDGELYLGGWNKQHVDGPLTWLPLSHEAYWQVPMSGASLGGTRITNVSQAILDTGTSLIIGDSDSVSALTAQLGCQPSPQDPRITVIPCDRVPSLPDVTFSLGEGDDAHDFTLAPRDYVLELQGGMFCMRVPAAAAQRPGRQRDGRGGRRLFESAPGLTVAHPLFPATTPSQLRLRRP